MPRRPSSPIERTAITEERVAVELGRIGFANMVDCIRVGPSGDPVLDFSKPDARTSCGAGRSHSR